MSESIAAQLEQLLLDLDRKRRIVWAPQLRLGRPAYDHLIAALRSDTITRHQRRNALVVLFRIRDHGDVGEVFAVIQRDLTHADKSVRSTATSLALGLERCGRAGPVDRDAIRRAMELGLSPLARGIAEKFLKEMEG